MDSPPRLRVRRFVRAGFWLLLLLPVVALLGFGGYVAWGTAQNRVLAEAETALDGNASVQVREGEFITFAPAGQPAGTGFIFYPGGLVPPGAYAPAMQAIAAQGYLVVLVPMPLNLAVFSPDRALEAIAAYPEIEHWAIGGHSLGGAMAARFADEHPDLVDGLVLWAAYPAESNSLAGRDLPVVSIYGERDGLATPAKIAESASLLPPETVYVEIAGGNHSQFGYYGDGPQRGDNEATISREQQQAQIVEATVQLLEMLGSSR